MVYLALQSYSKSVHLIKMWRNQLWTASLFTLDLTECRQDLSLSLYLVLKLSLRVRLISNRIRTLFSKWLEVYMGVMDTKVVASPDTTRYSLRRHHDEKYWNDDSSGYFYSSVLRIMSLLVSRHLLKSCTRWLRNYVQRILSYPIHETNLRSYTIIPILFSPYIIFCTIQ